ncbi:hypothetical protein KI688_009298 [Linnemannia hyalina]|uniref:Uncharacterized protein n=1 Tax=Linnemannia hyalina TaxID=64524 RepID=A0A9P8BW66_9FUNG|nr:hypothetical protein KI688_009298 [Linnemannia hyalina]
MTRFSSCRSSNKNNNNNTFLFLTTLLFTLLSILLTSHTTSAGGYTFQNPTAATRWSTGQPGLITIVSTDAAKADTPTTSRLLTITLRISSGGIFGSSTTVAVIKDAFQLLVPVGSTTGSVTLTISDWIVPATLAAGDKYTVHLARTKDGFFDIPDSVDSPTFQIVAAQSKAFQPASGTSPCSCGAALIVPNIAESASSASSNKNTFQSTGGPTTALAFLLLVVMTLF